MDGRQGQAEFGGGEIDDGDGGKLDRILRRPEDIGKNSSGDHRPALESDLRDNRVILALKIDSRRYRQDRIGLQMAITNADAPGEAL